MYNKNQSSTRREFVKGSLGAVVLAATATVDTTPAQSNRRALRLGGPVQAKDPDSWIQTLQKSGYRAAYCPVGANASDDVVKAYADAAKKADIVIAEVGAWSNPISPDEKQRNDAINKCKTQLTLAERIGANCCVNISGSRNAKNWAGPHEDNLTKQTFDLIVETMRNIIDHVKPIRTFFTLETMPWAYPDSIESYVQLLKAIDRKQFAVHFDPVNLICSPQRYYNNAAVLRAGFARLGPLIKSCHAKDIILSEKLTTHLDETRPGTGGLDYAAFLKELSKFPEVPLMMEHLKTQAEYKQAADYIRSVAQKNDLSFG
jgi:sugar phosphate isomerase/epimerase